MPGRPRALGIDPGRVTIKGGAGRLYDAPPTRARGVASKALCAISESEVGLVTFATDVLAEHLLEVLHVEPNEPDIIETEQFILVVLLADV